MRFLFGVSDLCVYMCVSSRCSQVAKDWVGFGEEKYEKLNSTPAKLCLSMLTFMEAGFSASTDPVNNTVYDHFFNKSQM